MAATTTPKENGSFYSSMEVAYRWIEEAGEDVVYLLPEDGIAYYIDGQRSQDHQQDPQDGLLRGRVRAEC